MGWSPLPTRGQAWLQDKDLLNEVIDAYNERVSVMGFRGGNQAQFPILDRLVRGSVMHSSGDMRVYDGIPAVGLPMMPWRLIQMFIEACFYRSKYNNSVYWERYWLINKSYDEVQGVRNVSMNNCLPFQTMTQWRAAAGLDAGDDGLETQNGVSFRRYVDAMPEDGGTVEYGIITRGDIMGPWLLEDIRKGLNALTLLRCYQDWENPGLWSSTPTDCINSSYVWAQGSSFEEAIANLADAEVRQGASGSPYDPTPLSPHAWTDHAYLPSGGVDATKLRENARAIVAGIPIVPHILGGVQVGMLVPHAVIYDIATGLGGPCDVYNRQGDRFSDNELTFHLLPIEIDCYDFPVWTSGTTYARLAPVQYTIAGTTRYYYSLIDGNTATPTAGDDANWQTMTEYKRVGSVVLEPDTSLSSLAWGGTPPQGVPNVAFGYQTLPGLGLADYSEAFEYT